MGQQQVVQQQGAGVGGQPMVPQQGGVGGQPLMPQQVGGQPVVQQQVIDGQIPLGGGLNMQQGKLPYSYFINFA